MNRFGGGRDRDRSDDTDGDKSKQCATGSESVHEHPSSRQTAWTDFATVGTPGFFFVTRMFRFDDVPKAAIVGRSRPALLSDPVAMKPQPP
jgi:hypothetical protein